VSAVKQRNVKLLVVNTYRCCNHLIATLTGDHHDRYHQAHNRRSPREFAQRFFDGAYFTEIAIFDDCWAEAYNLLLGYGHDLELVRCDGGRKYVATLSLDVDDFDWFIQD
jgi:hypothetical protein